MDDHRADDEGGAPPIDDAAPPPPPGDEPAPSTTDEPGTDEPAGDEPAAPPALIDEATGLEITEDGFAEASAYRTEAEAKAAGATLVEHGIGPEVRRIDHHDAAADVTVTAWQLLVLPYDHRRAQEILGIVEPAPVFTLDADEPIVLEKPPTPWKTILIIWLVALITIPGLAFVFTVWVLGR